MSTKMLVVGIDGGTWDVIDPLVENGLMPNLEGIKRTGVHGKLKSTHPPVSATAWASFMTGVNPGKHSIFNFSIKPKGAYYTEPVCARDIHGVTLWRYMGDKGRRVAVLNVPMTYPSEEVNGMLVTGLGTPDKSFGYTFPPELAAEIEDIVGDYVLDVNWTGYGDDEVDQFYDEIVDMTRKRYEVARFYLEKEDWDLFIVIFTGSDRIQHRLWSDVLLSGDMQAIDRDREARLVKNYFCYLDEVIGSVIGSAGKDSQVAILSDHGFGAFCKDIDLNWWLAQEEWFSFREQGRGNQLLRAAKRALKKLGVTKRLVEKAMESTELKKGLYKYLESGSAAISSVDWGSTKAFSIASSGIYVNVKGRERKGAVEEGEEYEKFRNDLSERLCELRDEAGENRIFWEVKKREDIYHGEHLEEAPDLVITDYDRRYVGIDCMQKGKDERSVFLKNTKFQKGGHALYGIVLFSGQGLKKGYEIADAEIVDMMPTILHLSGLAVPARVDGVVLTEMFEEPQNVLVDEDDNLSPGEEGGQRSGEELSAAEKEKIVERLKGLGYME